MSRGAWHFWGLLRALEMGVIILIINNGLSTEGTVLYSFFGLFVCFWLHRLACRILVP